MKNNTLLRRGRTSTLAYHLLSLPAVLLSGLIILVPGIQTIYSAFTKCNGISANKEWIGLRNFEELATDWVFKQSIVNNFKWTLMFITVPVIIAMVAAVLMARFHIGSQSFQAIYLVPYLLAPTTNAIIWLNMIFSPNAGLVGFLQKLGWEITSPLGNMETALAGVAAVDIWHYWGFLTVIFLAALRQTPQDQLEAAEL
ncbi:MAG: sugar ABC transporter permease, partial [Ruminiclostridium sp.]|nr:sugar ABC transporter permease [Ruminiclostridium sp.]